MFSIQYTEKSNEYPLGLILGKVHLEASWLYPGQTFIFEASVKGKIRYSVGLSPDCWGSWEPLDNEGTVVRIYGINGEVKAEFKLDRTVHRDASSQFFDEWVNLNPGAFGIAIGTHDGLEGEWVKSVRDNRINAILVEGSYETYLELAENYKRFANAKCLNIVISTKSEEIEFYEFGTGEANTIDTEHAKLHAKGDEIKTTQVNAIGLTDLIVSHETEIRWLHLDTEGIDDKLIMSLDFTKISKPELIIFETVNISKERIGDSIRLEQLFEWLDMNGYNFVNDYWNSFAYLKQ